MQLNARKNGAGAEGKQGSTAYGRKTLHAGRWGAVVTTWPSVQMVLVAVMLGCVLLGSIGTAQWLILRRYMAPCGPMDRRHSWRLAARACGVPRIRFAGVAAWPVSVGDMDLGAIPVANGAHSRLRRHNR
jgi:hypothetical protein